MPVPSLIVSADWRLIVMKLSSWAWAWALMGCLFLSDASAQGLRQPFSVQPAGFDYNRYLNEDTASPSDQPAPVVNSTQHSAPAPVAQGAPVASAGCDTGCASSGCDAACCDSGCSSCGCASACNSCGGCSSCGCGCGLNLTSLTNSLGLGNCCLGEPFSLGSALFCEGSCWTAGGWTQVGYHDENNGQFNNHRGDVNLHQQWLYLEKTAKPTDCCWDWGFRADLMYGVDGADTQAFGNTLGGDGNPRGWDTGWNHGIYGWALPQLYLEVARGDLSIKAGHFYTLVGYEVVAAPDNFFYSHSFTMYNSEPFTHTGVIATYSVNDCLDVYAGWTLGWDTGFDQFDDGNSFLGGVSATLTDDITMTYISTIGDFGWRGDDGYMQSVVFDTQLTDNLQWVFQTDYLRVDETGEDNTGINQYFIYTINDCLSLGHRVEWWKTDPLIAGAGSLSVYESTWGINYKPHANLIVRPEIREEWSPALDYDQTIFGVDVIATY